MTINYPKSNYYHHQSGKLHYLDLGIPADQTIVFLHGFTGSSRDFHQIPDFLTDHYRCLIPDLPGHGKTLLSEEESVFSTTGQVMLLHQWLNFLNLSKFHLFGYSMGGRLALQFAVKYSLQLSSLILVSSTAGIQDDTARQNRAQADWELSQKILNSDPVDFLQSWLEQPLFQELTAKGKNFLAQEILRRLPIQPAGLASSLQHFSSGVMPPVWEQAIAIQTPTLVIAGSRDQKYLELAKRLVSLLPNGNLKIFQTGHTPLIEAPDLLWQEVVKFLQHQH